MATPTTNALSLPDALTGRYQGRAALPSYDRSSITAGIVHLGVGGFHRAHQGVYVDRLLGQGHNTQWGIAGVGILDNDSKMRDALAPQDNLYTVVEKAPDGQSTGRVVGAMVDYSLVADDSTAVIEQLASPHTRIVSLTITEGGYNLEPATGAFDEANPAVTADLAAQGRPRTHFRLIHDALKVRRERQIPPFAVMSCDNIRGNGDVARRTLLRYAELEGTNLTSWIEDSVAFPNSMVDRITPITEDADRDMVADVYGLCDAWPVVCESFTQWVLEDRFPQGRPALEDVGVQFVPNVLPYELMKLRLLNASHLVLGSLSFIAGYKYVDQAMSDPHIRKIVADFQRREAQPTLPHVPGIDLASYCQTLIERFENPGIKDTIARMCLQTSTMLPNFLLPIIRDQLTSHGNIARGAATVAAWAARCEEGDTENLVDRRRNTLIARARDTANPYAFIEDQLIFGQLAYNTHFRNEFLRWRQILNATSADQFLAQLADLAL